jgi:hypothetical protein
MKYIFVALLSIFIMFSLPVLVKAAPGNVVIEAHTLAWDRSTDVQVIGYYAYWRSPNVAPNPWVNSQRSALIPQPVVGVVPTYDIYQFNLALGTYELAATATDATGNESGVSNVVPFVLKAPPLLVSPMNARKQ